MTLTNGYKYTPTEKNDAKGQTKMDNKRHKQTEMDNNSQADAAIKALNGTDMKGRTITVNQARPKTERSSHSRRF